MTLPSYILPFALTLNTSTECNVVQCEQLLRNLPGKRHVYKGTWQSRHVIVKLFLDSTSASRHWNREKAGAEALETAHVDSPEILFSGKLETGTPVLIYAFLPDAQTAQDVWDKLETLQQRRAFLCRLVEIIGRLHGAGLVQEDLHLENFLVSGKKIYAIDGDAIHHLGLAKPLSHEIVSKNLALLFAQLLPKYDPLIDSTVMYYAKYCNVPVSQLLDMVKLALPVLRRRRRHKYVEKCYRTCSEFVRSKTRGQVAVFSRDAQGETLRCLLTDPELFMRHGVLLKDGKTSTVARVQVDGHDWVIKRYNIKNPWHALTRCLRPTRGWISWGNAHRLKISGIATPRSVAVIEKRFGPFRSTGYYVCEYVAGSHAGDFFLTNKVVSSVKERVAGEFVHLFELLYRLGINHGDYKATNFLVNDTTPWVIDLDVMNECCFSWRFKKIFLVDRQRFLRNWKLQPSLLRWFDENLPK